MAQELVFRLRADAGEFVVAIDGAAASLKRLDGQTGAVDRSSEESSAELKRLTAAAAGLRREVESLSGSVSSVGGALKTIGQAANQSAAGLTSAGEGGRRAAADFSGAGRSAESLIKQLVGVVQQSGGVRGALGEMAPAARQAASSIVGMGAGVSALAAGVLALGVAWRQGDAEASGYRKTLALTGNAAGLTADQLAMLARSTAEVSGTVNEAAQILTKLAASGQIVPAVMDEVAAAIAAMASTGMVDVDALVASFGALADDPVRAILKLNETYNFLTPTIWDQIRALQEQGRQEEATALAQQTAARAVADRAAEVARSAGTMERAWNAVAGAAKSAWDWMRNLGREKTLQDKIAEQKKFIEDLENNRAAGNVAVAAGVLKRMEAELAAQQAAAQADRERASTMRDYAAAVDEVGRVQGRGAAQQRTLSQALEEYRGQIARIRAENPESAALDPAKIAAGEAAIRKQFESTRGLRREQQAVARETKALQAALMEGAGLSANFYTEWDRLTKLFQDGKFGAGAAAVDALAEAQRRLLDKQPAVRAAAQEEDREHKALAKALGERERALSSMVEAEARRTASLEEANARATEELATMGMTEQQLAAYTAAKYHAAAAADEQAAAELDVAAALLDQQRTLPEVAAQYRRLAAEKRRSAQANREAAGLAIEKGNAEAAQAVKAEWQRSSQQIESAVYDAIVAGGVDGAELLKRTINSLILQPAVRMVVQGGTNAVMGMMGGGGAGGVAGIGGIGGSSGGGGINGIPGMGSMIGGGLVSLGGAIGMTTGMGGFLGSMGGAMSAGLGGFSGSMSAAYASMQAGATASAAGYAIGAVMPYIAAIIAIASAVGAFKGPTYHTGAAVMTGTDDSQTTLRHKEAVGGDTRVWGGFTETSAKGGGQYAKPLKELGQSVANTIEGTLSAFGVGQQVSVYTAFGADGDDKSRGAMRVYDAAGNLLGANSDQALRGAKYSKDPSKGFAEFADDAGRVIRDALVAADLPAWVDDVLTGLGDAPGIELVGTALGQIETLRTMGEQVGPMLALTAEQMAGLAPAAGGLEAVIATLSGYAEATLTDAERYALAGAQLQAMRDRIVELGFDVPTTVEEFRALTDGIDLSTQAGREMRVEMMAMAPAFAAAQAAVVSLIGTTRDDIAAIIRAGLTGNATREEVGARLEEAVVGGIQNAMAASVSTQVADLMIAGIINPAVETLVMGGELNRAAMRAQLDAAVAEISERVAAFNAIISSVEVQDALGDLRISMRSIATTVTPVTRTVSSATSSMASAASSAANKLRDAEEALRSAYQSRADELRSTIDQFDDFSRSLREFRESLYMGADSPLSLSARTAEAERQFRAVGAQARLGDLDAMGRLSAVGSDYLAAQRDSAASALDYARAVALVSGTAAAAEGTAQRQADVAREQLSLLDRTVSALIKIDDSVLSVEQAIRDYLAVDKGGAARLRAAGIPGYASGGHHTGGLRIVGERGPELEATGPARIWSADQTRALFAGDGDLLAELQALRREVAALRAESAATARHTHATSRTLERVTRGGRAMQVVEDAA